MQQFDAWNTTSSSNWTCVLFFFRERDSFERIRRLVRFDGYIEFLLPRLHTRGGSLSMINGNCWNKYRKSNQVPPFPPLLHLENGINRKRFSLAESFEWDISVPGIMVLVPSVFESNAEPIFERVREDEGEKERAVIDYANDQLDERSSDSSPVANAIAVWQFAALRVHLTRFKNCDRRGADTKKRRLDRKSIGGIFLRLTPAFNGFARMKRISTGISLSTSLSRWMLDIAELTR